MLVATSCGRFGFGQHDPDGDARGDTSDAAGPVAVPQFCDERTVTTLPGLDTVAIRAVALDMKYAVAIETTSNDIALLELDAQGALVATHAAFTPGYAPLYGIARHNELPVVSLFTGGAYYIKFVEAGWEAYGTGPSGDAHVIDPPYVEIDATRGIGGRISGDFNVGVIDGRHRVDQPGGPHAAERGQRINPLVAERCARRGRARRWRLRDVRREHGWNHEGAAHVLAVLRAEGRRRGR